MYRTQVYRYAAGTGNVYFDYIALAGQGKRDAAVEADRPPTNATACHLSHCIANWRASGLASRENVKSPTERQPGLLQEAHYKDFLNMRYLLHVFAPASSINELIDSLSSRVQPNSR